MASTVRYETDTAGLRELARSKGIEAGQQAVAQAVLDRGQQLAPRHLRGRYGKSLELLGSDSENDGTVTHAGSRWPFAHLVEFGSVHNPPYAPLRRAISALGLRFKPGRA